MTDSLIASLGAALGEQYAIERELGGGGMSRVFVALEKSLGRRVVIKTMPDGGWSSGAVERFRREISLAAQLQHANIVPVLSAGEVDGAPFYIMPFVDGASLRQRLAGGALPTRDAVWVLRDMARALQAAHTRGVVHRDIKPENVLLAEGAALVTDFGVAKALSVATGNDNGMTAVGTAIGTPAYMAPEQLAADPTLDHRADIYAWGVVAYEALSGARPFASLSGSALMRAQMTEAPAPLNAPAASPALRAFIMRCLSKDPADRPASARELIDALDNVSSDGGLHTSSASPDSRTGSLNAARRLRVLVPVLLAVAAVVAAGVWWSRRDADAPTVERTAVAPFRVGGASADVRYLREGLGDLLLPQLQAIPDMRVVPMSSLLARWRQEAGDAQQDLEQASALQVAKRAGATRLVVGEIVGTREHLSITAHLIRVADGVEERSSKQEGAADSAGVMGARLLIELLAVGDAATKERLTVASAIRPAALFAYLEGEQLYRRGRYAAAGEIFARGWSLDSTFALAALRVIQCNGWQPSRPIDGPWTDRAWQSRKQLHGADSLMLLAVAGATYPEPMPRLELLKLNERLAQQGGSAELWFQYADLLLHNGATLDVAGSDSLALEGFKVAESIDSTFAPALEHLPGLYAIVGDSARAFAALARQARVDSVGDYYLLSKLLLTQRFASRRELAPALDAYAAHNAVLLPLLARFAELNAPLGFRPSLELADTLMAMARRTRNAVTPEEFATATRLLAWNRGQPQVAARAVAARENIKERAVEVMAGALWDGDSSVARASAEGLRTWLATSRVGDSKRLLARFAIATWAVSRGDTTVAREQLKAIERDSVALNDASRRATLAQVLRAQLAVAAHAAGALAEVARADTMLRDAPRVDRQYERPAGNLVTGILYLALRQPASAQRVLQRRDMQVGIDMFEARRLWRLADAAHDAGDVRTEEAALRDFVQLRERAEGPLRDDVRAAQARLTQLRPR